MPFKDKSPDWLFFADSNLKSAKIMFREGIYHIVSFHAQQVLEKSLKAFIVRQKNRMPKTHFLNRLYSLSNSLPATLMLSWAVCQKAYRIKTMPPRP